MKAVVSKSDLRDALAYVIPAVAAKPSTPILSGVYLRAENSSLIIRATNFNLDITAKIPANVEVEGATVATGKHFNAIVNKLGGDIVTLQDGNNQLTIKSEAASFDILTMDAGDFPAALKLDEENSFRIHTGKLKDIIRRTVFACSKDESRPAFTGVHVEIIGTALAAIATNTHRIAIVDEEVFDETEANVIIPAAALRLIQSAQTNDTIATITLDKKYATFEFENVQIITRLIDGTFPPAKNIIPKSCATTAEVDVAELRTAIERMQVIASADQYNKVRMIFTQDGLEISADSADVGKAIEHVDAKVSGGDLEIAFKVEYLLDALKVLASKSCTFGMNQPLTPVMITGADDPGYIYIVTPLRTY